MSEVAAKLPNWALDVLRCPDTGAALSLVGSRLSGRTSRIVGKFAQAAQSVRWSVNAIRQVATILDFEAIRDADVVFVSGQDRDAKL